MTASSSHHSARADSRAGAWLSCVRGGVLGLVAMLLSYAGHVVAGGHAVPTPELILPLVLSTASCVLLSRRRLSFLAILGAVGGSQLAFHLWFLRADLVPAAGRPTMSPTTMGQMPGGLGLMVAAHATAAVVSALLLLAGEDGLWDLLSLAARRLWVAVLVFLAVPTAPSPARVAADLDVASWVSRLVESIQRRRGPPAPGCTVS